MMHDGQTMHDGAMDGMGWMMGAMGAAWLLAFVVLLLAAAALLRYLRG